MKELGAWGTARERAGSRAHMRGAALFRKALSEEAAVSQADCEKVLKALARVVSREVRATGSVQIPHLARVQKKIRKATQGGPKRIFGRVVELPPQPETIRLKFQAAKNLTDEIQDSGSPQQ